jgi:hypothetical protein
VRAVVEIRSGPLAGRRIPVEQGQTLRVGRKDDAELVIAGDTQMSGAHFSIACDEKTCRLLDLGSANGTFLNGERVTEARLREGDRVRAGETTFLVRLEEAVVAAPNVPGIGAGTGTGTGTGTGMGGLLGILRTHPEPLFALLDAARDRRIRKLLKGCRDEVASLYDGLQGQLLEDYAPYLVRLPPDSPLLEALAREGWGKSWGVYLGSKRPFKEVRRHFRRFLIVKEDETDEDLYFRFYDPRVLRVFLPSCTPRQAGLFFEDVGAYLMEDREPGTLLRFTAGAAGASGEALALSP